MRVVSPCKHALIQPPVHYFLHSITSTLIFCRIDVLATFTRWHKKTLTNQPSLSALTHGTGSHHSGKLSKWSLMRRQERLFWLTQARLRHVDLLAPAHTPPAPFIPFPSVFPHMFFPKPP